MRGALDRGGKGEVEREVKMVRMGEGVGERGLTQPSLRGWDS